MKIGMKNPKSNSIISLKIRKVVKLLNLDFGSFISITLCGEFSFFTYFFGEKTSQLFINFFTKKRHEESFEFLSYI